MLFKNKISIAVASALLLAAGHAIASDYYVVVPVPNHTADSSAINVTLGGASLPAGQVGMPYQGFDLKPLLSVTGDATYTGYGVRWSIASGSLPAGLTLNSNGTISGTPAAGGTFSFQVLAAYKTKAGQQAYQLLVADIKVSLDAASPPQAVVGAAYSYDLRPLLSVTGDGAYTGQNVTWSMVSSSLPAGLYLTSDGFIGGTPSTSGTGSLTARATYRNSSGQQTYQVVSVYSISVVLGSSTPTQAIVGQAYTFDAKPLLTVTGDPAYTGGGVTWGIASGSLPAGLSLSANGVITGTPTAASSGPVTLQATYRGTKGQQTYQLVSLNIVVNLGTATLPLANVGASYSYDFKPLLGVTGDSSYAVSAVQFHAGALPPGLSLSATGVLSGTPTVTASAQNFSVVADYRGLDGTQQYAITVNPAFFNFSPTIAASTANYNVYNAARAAGWDGVAPLKATVTVNGGVYVGGSSTGSYAFSTGTGFPAQTSLNLINNGVIVGKGGDGGSWGFGGGNGGPAMLAQYPIKVTNNGTIAGGGGGGGGSNRATVANVLAGGAGGGGGQGYGTSAGGAADPAFSGTQYPQGQPGLNGNITTPGLGGTGTQSGMFPNQFQAPWYAISGNGGNGGLLGQAGAASTAGQWVPNVGSLSGGAAGYSVVGAANVTWSATGSVLGPRQ
jgi:hypothetical protein